MSLLNRWRPGNALAARSRFGARLVSAFVCVAPWPVLAQVPNEAISHVTLLYGIGEDNAGLPPVSGVAISPTLVIAPAGALKDADRVLVGRGKDAKLKHVRHLSVGGKDIITVSIDAQTVAGFSPLANDDPTETFHFTAITAKPGGVDTTIGTGRPGSKPSIHSIDPISARGAALFNSCGEVVGLSSGRGSVVLVGALVSALRKAHVPIEPAKVACANADAGNSAGLRKERDAAVASLNNEKVKGGHLVNAALTKAKAAELKRQQEQSMMLRYVAIGGGVLALLTIGIGTWFWIRSRRLNRELEDAKGAIRKTRPAWSDCVLEGSGGTLKLSGLRLANGGVVVGRSRQEADVLLDKEDISRKHARFEVVDDAVEISDLGSMNKTLVNDVPLDSGRVRRLYDGDWVMLASNKFQFKVLQRRG